MFELINLNEYYNREGVLKEIVDFSKNRWLAIHCEQKTKEGGHILIRYIRKNVPLTIKTESDLKNIMKQFEKLKPRTIYATANVYKDLSSRQKVMDYFNNVIARTPTWDIDSIIDNWKYTIEVAKAIANELDKEGVSDSVYFIWSGNGLHVHIHEQAFSKELYLRINPIDVGYAVVEYITKRIMKYVHEINLKVKNTSKPIKVENLMDPQRVFTVPMSLHRELNVSTIALKVNDLENFDISWLNPKSPKSNKDWRKYTVGEADNLAEKAYSVVGPYMFKLQKGRRKSKYGVRKITSIIESAMQEALKFEEKRKKQ